MPNYKDILVLHAIDGSTGFLSPFQHNFEKYYHGFDSKKESIQTAKTKLGGLESESLIIFVGHGSSMGLYEPDDQNVYENFFLDPAWGNHYLENHDVLLLSCRSNEFIKKVHTASSLIGFGNIISSVQELEIHNEKEDIKKHLSEPDIQLFNCYFIEAVIKSIKLLITDKIKFHELAKYIDFNINKCLINVLKNKSYPNRIELAKLLFEFRDEIIYQNNNRLNP
jgi:cobalamin biosynthesis Co2+ chelatase CbiK